MKKLVHYLELRAFKYPSEDPEKVKKSISNALNLSKEKLQEELKEDIVDEEKSKVTKYTYRTENHGQIKKIIKRIFRNSEEKINPGKHLDNEGNFYLRIDKQKAYGEKIDISTEGDVIHLKLKMAAYPFSREKAKENLEKLIDTNG